MTRHARTLMIALGAALAAGGAGTGGPGTQPADRLGLQPPTQAVLVTGASTGIGRKITEVLASKGYFVYAGARKDQDLKELSAIPNVQGIKLDVTVKEDIAAAVATVEKAGRGLAGLVNNAGVAIVEPLIEVEEEDMNFIFDVNVYGPYRMTKAFSKLLIASKGRVTTIGSISGILAGPLLGPYSMTKHAIEAYTDALAAELARVGVKVSVIDPGDYASAMGKNVVRRMRERGKKIEGSLFEKELRGLMERESQESRDPPPDDVAEAVVHALFDPNPKVRYMVVPNQRQAASTLRKALLNVVQLNEGQKFSFNRDALVAMLDSALARSSH